MNNGRLFLLLGFTLLTVGCRIPGAVEETWTEDGRPLAQTDWYAKKAFFRSFRHSEITATYTAMASGPGGTANAYGQTISTSDHVPTDICNLAQRKLPFDIVTPIMSGKDPDYILEGHISGPNGWEGEWWTWAQLIVLWVPSYVLPSNGTYYTFDFELNLYDTEHRLLHSWHGVRVKHYYEWLWAMMVAVGRSKEYEQEFLADALTKVGEDMRKFLPPEGGN